MIFGASHGVHSRKLAEYQGHENSFINCDAEIYGWGVDSSSHAPLHNCATVAVAIATAFFSAVAAY